MSEPTGPDRPTDAPLGDFLEKLAADLGLTAEQRAELRAIHVKWAAELAPFDEELERSMNVGDTSIRVTPAEGRAAAQAGTAPADALRQAAQSILDYWDSFADHETVPDFGAEMDSRLYALRAALAVGAPPIDQEKFAEFQAGGLDEIGEGLRERGKRVVAPAAPKVCQHCGGKGYTDCPTNKGETHCCPYCLGGAPAAPAPEPDNEQIERLIGQALGWLGFGSPPPGFAAVRTTEEAKSILRTFLRRVAEVSGGAPPAARPAEPPPAKEREYARQILLVIGWSFWQSEGVWLGVNAGLNLNALGDTPDECYDCALDASELLLRDLVRAAPPPSEAPRGPAEEA